MTKLIKVYLDIGFGFWKALADNNNRHMCQSAYASIPVNLNGTGSGIESDFGNFIFGKTALDMSAMHQRFTGFDNCLTDEYAAAVLYLISELYGALNFDCELVLSLPFEAWRHHQFNLQKRLAGSHKVKRIGYRQQTINISFPAKWGVVPQNVMPVFAGINFSKLDGNEVWIASGNSGALTFEMGAFGLNLKTFEVLPGTLAQQGSLQRGMYTLANDIRLPLLDYLQGQRSSFGQQELFDILVSNRVQVGGKQIDVSEIVNPIRQEYLSAIAGACQERWTAQSGRELGRFNIYYQSGGGTPIVAPYLQSVNFHNNICFSSDSQNDVVVGAKKFHELI